MASRVARKWTCASTFSLATPVISTKTSGSSSSRRASSVNDSSGKRRMGNLSLALGLSTTSFRVGPMSAWIARSFRQIPSAALASVEIFGTSRQSMVLGRFTRGT